MNITISKRAASLGMCAGLAVAAVAAGGVAMASGSSAVIHGCASRQTGALFLTAHCKPGYRSVSWNQTGPAGPSNAYYYHDDTLVAMQGSVPSVVGSVALPTGSYVVTAVAMLMDSTTFGGYGTCYLTWPAGATGSDNFGAENLPTETVFNEASIPVTGQGVLTEPGTLDLTCNNIPGGYVDYVDMTATRVTTLSQ
jgi:hypothetical protein